VVDSADEGADINSFFKSAELTPNTLNGLELYKLGNKVAFALPPGKISVPQALKHWRSLQSFVVFYKVSRWPWLVKRTHIATHLQACFWAICVAIPNKRALLTGISKSTSGPLSGSYDDVSTALLGLQPIPVATRPVPAHLKQFAVLVQHWGEIIESRQALQAALILKADVLRFWESLVMFEE
jgi:hypothetical protein